MLFPKIKSPVYTVSNQGLLKKNGVRESTNTSWNRQLLRNTTIWCTNMCECYEKYPIKFFNF